MDQGQFRKYFIGDLSESDAAAIEELTIADATFEGELLEAENTLIEDYLDDSLTEAELKLFNSNYLITPERRANIESTRALRDYSQLRLRSDSRTPQPVRPQPSFVDKLSSMFRSIPVPAFAAFAVVLVALFAGYLWLGRNSELDKLQTEYAALNKAGNLDPSNFKSADTITLMPGSLRGSSSNLKTLGTTNDRILTRIALPIEFKDEAGFDVVLFKDGKAIFTFSSVPGVDAGGGKELRLVLPRSQLTAGSYKLESRPSGKNGSPVNYEFTVE